MWERVTNTISIARRAIIDVKLCCRCGHHSPIEHFRLHNKNGTKRHSECRTCHAEMTALRAAAKRAGKVVG